MKSLRNYNKTYFSLQNADSKTFLRFLFCWFDPNNPRCLRAWLMHAIDFCAFSFPSLNIHRYLTSSVKLLK